MAKSKSRILILKAAGLSQFVEAEPSFAAIRNNHPGHPVDLLTSHEYGRLAKGAPYFDRVLAAGPFKDAKARKNFLSQLRKQGYSAVYDLDGSEATSAIRKSLSGFRGAKWVGPKKILNRKSNVGEMVPSFSGTAMRKLLSDNGLLVEDRLPDLSWALSGRKDAANMRPSWYGISGEFALMMPSRDETRRWPAECYAELASEMVKRGVTPVLVGNADMKTFGNTVTQIMVQIGPKGGARALVDLTDKTDLAQLAALAREASFFFSGVTEEVYLTMGLGCPGILITHPYEDDVADVIHGRDVVRFKSPDAASIEPATTIKMLVSMGVLPAERVARTETIEDLSFA